MVADLWPNIVGTIFTFAPDAIAKLGRRGQAQVGRARDPSRDIGMVTSINYGGPQRIEVGSDRARVPAGSSA